MISVLVKKVRVSCRQLESPGPASGALRRRLGFLLELYAMASSDQVELLRSKLTSAYDRLDPTLPKSGSFQARWRFNSISVSTNWRRFLIHDSAAQSLPSRKPAVQRTRWSSHSRGRTGARLLPSLVPSRPESKQAPRPPDLQRGHRAQTLSFRQLPFFGRSGTSRLRCQGKISKVPFTLKKDMDIFEEQKISHSAAEP